MKSMLPEDMQLNGKSLAAELKRLRTAAGLSFEWLSKRSFVDVKYLHELETGKKARPSRDVLIRIGIGLNLEMTDIDDLLAVAGWLPLVPLRSIRNGTHPPANINTNSA